MVERIKEQFGAFVKDEEGASMVEYILLVALIAAVCIGAFTLLGKNANTKITDVSNKVVG